MNGLATTVLIERTHPVHRPVPSHFVQLKKAKLVVSKLVKRNTVLSMSVGVAKRRTHLIRETATPTTTKLLPGQSRITYFLLPLIRGIVCLLVARTTSCIAIVGTATSFDTTTAMRCDGTTEHTKTNYLLTRLEYE